ncbi:MAG: putative hydro-lyase [Proteobacteria bacterium]|nr:putative hydro-lyase [Pseudomonadota bacterium]
MASATDGRRHSQLSTGRDVRLACRNGSFSGNTADLAPGYVQGNLVILPADLAGDFLRYAQANPKPCPLLGVSDVGSPHIPLLGRDLDLRTDLPRYRVWKDGALIEEPRSIKTWWRNDLVAFVIGCSFTFEAALLDDGIPLRHVSCGANISMYRTTIQTTPAGAFHGPMVVSMRPLKAADAIRAVQITSRFPAMHGAPVHLGDPALIGIGDLAKPDYGDAVPVEPDEIPVFWACGVTPQAAIAAARPGFAMTHAPGSMLVTDRRNSEFSVI